MAGGGGECPFLPEQAEWRLTEWRQWDGRKLTARWDIAPNATELYSHCANASGQAHAKRSGMSTGTGTHMQQQAGLFVDPFDTETANLAGDPTMSGVLAELRPKLRAAFGY